MNEQEIEQCLNNAAKRYFYECQQRIPLFCKNYFAYPGCWQLNKQAFGWDLLRAPLNLFWAPFYLTCHLLLLLSRRMQWRTLQQVLNNLPSGFTTRVQKKLSEKIQSDLLQRSTPHQSKPDRFVEIIVEELEHSFEKENQSAVDHRELYQQFEPLVKETLEQYNVTRTASADITNVAASTILGAFAFKKFTPGGLGLGFLFAGLAVKQAAVNNFIFGETLGSVYYSVFPPEPTATALAAATLAALVALAFFSAISGVISDPLQYLTGLHAKRLKKMVHQLEKDFLEKTASNYHPKDQYIARALDIFDALKSHIF